MTYGEAKMVLEELAYGERWFVTQKVTGAAWEALQELERLAHENARQAEELEKEKRKFEDAGKVIETVRQLALDRRKAMAILQSRVSELSEEVEALREANETLQSLHQEALDESTRTNDEYLALLVEHEETLQSLAETAQRLAEATFVAQSIKHILDEHP